MTILNKWWFSTADELVGIIKCHDDITGEDKFYISGDAVIIEDERNDFVKGNIICKECLKKKRVQECQ